MVAQGELWLMETPNQKRRPVLILSRDEVIPVINIVAVAPVTSTIRAIPTSLPGGPDDGIDHDRVATFDNLAAVPKSVLTRRLRLTWPQGAPAEVRRVERTRGLLTVADGTTQTAGPPRDA